MASSARKTRPPSMGKAGMRLNTSRMTLATATCARKLAYGPSKAICEGSTIPSAPTPSTSASTRAITRFTAGPASATTISWLGFSGMRSMEATPPIGNSVTSGVRMP